MSPEQQSLRRKFQEVVRREGPSGDLNCPQYIICAKRLSRDIVKMVDASSGGSEEEQSVDEDEENDKIFLGNEYDEAVLHSAMMMKRKLRELSSCLPLYLAI